MGARNRYLPPESNQKAVVKKKRKSSATARPLGILEFFSKKKVKPPLHWHILAHVHNIAVSEMRHAFGPGKHFDNSSLSWVFERPSGKYIVHASFDGFEIGTSDGLESKSEADVESFIRWLNAQLKKSEKMAWHPAKARQLKMA